MMDITLLYKKQKLETPNGSKVAKHFGTFSTPRASGNMIMTCVVRCGRDGVENRVEMAVK